MTNQLEALDRLIEAVEAGEWEVVTQEQRYSISGETDGWDNIINAQNAYHGSLDAAKALHEALLPGWFYCLMDRCAEVRSEMEYGHQYIGKAESTARAWLLAQLRAQIGGQ